MRGRPHGHAHLSAGSEGTDVASGSVPCGVRRGGLAHPRAARRAGARGGHVAHAPPCPRARAVADAAGAVIEGEPLRTAEYEFQDHTRCVQRGLGSWSETPLLCRFLSHLGQQRIARTAVPPWQGIAEPYGYDIKFGRVWRRVRPRPQTSGTEAAYCRNDHTLPIRRLAHHSLYFSR